MTLGAASGLVTRTSVDHWYPKQLKPPGEPPRKAFPIVWSLLYAGMGLASSRLVNAWDRSPSFLTRDNAKSALMAYGLQLALNLAWTPLFFGLQKPVPALVDIVALTVTNYRLSVGHFSMIGCCHPFLPNLSLSVCS